MVKENGPLLLRMQRWMAPLLLRPRTKRKTVACVFFVAAMALLYSNTAWLSEQSPHPLQDLPTEKCVAPRSVPELDEPFRWNQLDLSSKAPCGWNKCFFRWKPPHNNVAYLIQQAQSPEDVSCQYTATKYLEETYNITHFLLEPPREATITKPVAETLNRNSYMVMPRPDYNNQSRLYEEHVPIVYQKVRVAPDPSLVLGCTKPKLQHVSEHWSDFVRSVPNKDQFVANLVQYLHRATRLLQEEPWLAPDFQFMVDRYGNVYNLDVAAYGLHSRRFCQQKVRVCRAAFSKLVRLFEKGTPIAV